MTIERAITNYEHRLRETMLWMEEDYLGREATAGYSGNAAHEVVVREVGQHVVSYYFRRPKSLIFAQWFHFTAFTVSTTGDGPDMIIRGGPADPRAKLRWLAESDLAGYLTGKVCAGEAWSWDSDVALAEIKSELTELRDSAADVRIEVEKWETLIEAWEDASPDCEGEMYIMADEAGLDCTDFHHFGRTVSYDLMRVQVAARCLLRALLPSWKTEPVGE